MNAAVSVIIPVYNGARHLPAQLAALAGQRTDVSWELVMADNGSTDSTLAVVERWRGRLGVPLTVVDASARPGPAYARNCGAQVAVGQVFAFCDSDDEVAPDWVEQASQATSESGVAAGLVQPVDRAALNPEVLTRSTTWRVLGSNFAISREVFRSVGGFNADLGPYAAEDSDLSLRLQGAGNTIDAAPGMVVAFRRTRSPRVLVRKVFNTGKGEVLIQASLARPLPTVGATVASVATWPLAAVRHLRAAPEAATLRPVGRDLILRVGHLVGRLELARARRRNR